MKAYIKVDATKELPEKEDTYNIFFKHIPDLAHPCIFEKGKWSVSHSDRFPVQSWLKEIDLSELMIEWLDEMGNYILVRPNVSKKNYIPFAVSSSISLNR